MREKFRLLRTKIVIESQQRGDRLFLVTSTQNREGKTFTAMNLAITFAQEYDHEVLLVDGNLKNPSILKYLGIERQPGLLDCLHDNVPLSELMICPGIKRLLVLPLGRRQRQSEELMRSRKVSTIFKEMKRRRQDLYIIVDGPALCDGFNATVLSNFADQTLFVVEHGMVKKKEITEAISLLDKEKIFGAVFNKRAA